MSRTNNRNWLNRESGSYRENWRSSTSLIGPGVAGEPGRWDQVLAGVVEEVHIALAGPSVVRADAVALCEAVGVHPGEGGALTADVEGGGGGLVVHLAVDCQESGGEEQDCVGEHCVRGSGGSAPPNALSL